MQPVWAPQGWQQPGGGKREGSGTGEGSGVFQRGTVQGHEADVLGSLVWAAGG